MSAYERQQGQYRISTDPERLDPDAIHAYLTRSYWSEGIFMEIARPGLYKRALDAEKSKSA
jgi:hypothetical protein